MIIIDKDRSTFSDAEFFSLFYFLAFVIEMDNSVNKLFTERIANFNQDFSKYLLSMIH